MQKKHWIALTLVIAALATLLVSGKPGSGEMAPEKVPGEICRKAKGDCIKKATQPGQMILESMSRQFISILPGIR
jgi:hypothetical protein